MGGNNSVPRRMQTPHRDAAAAMCEGYEPHHMDLDDWARIKPLTIDVMGLIEWCDRDTCRSMLLHVGNLLLFTELSGHGLNPDIALRPEQVERFCAVGMKGFAHGSISSFRSRLRDLGRAHLPMLWPDFRRYRTKGVTPPPYDEEEIARLFASARALHATIWRQRALAYLLFGLGCGLSVYDFRYLAGSHVVTVDGGVDVHVPGHDVRKRVVPCLDRYADDLAQLAHAVGDDLFVGTLTNLSRRNLSPSISKRLENTNAPRLNTTRLRTTWIVEQLRACTPLDALMAAAGVTTMGFIQNTLDHVPTADAEMARDALRRGCP